jgi:hypothetical protein
LAFSEEVASRNRRKSGLAWVLKPLGATEQQLNRLDAAIAHAREAAQDRYFSAILKIGPHLPAGQMDPDEVAAWGLIDASVEQQGCGGDVFTVRAMQNIISTLNAPNIAAAAREQAEQFWSEYGSQIKANLGCSPWGGAQRRVGSKP